MNVFRSFAEARKKGNIRSLALGFFDGIHRGHQQVIANALSGGFAIGSGVLTFDPHPQTVLFPEKAPQLLTGLPHKLRDLSALGVKNILLLPFDKKMALTAAGRFLQELGNSFPGLQQISVGANWRFGHSREGDTAMLRHWCDARQITLIVTDSALCQGKTISSSRIRGLVANGRLGEASELLGKPYSLFGAVVKGSQLGRQIGFPTANLATFDQSLPPHGVYFGSVTIDKDPAVIRAAINIGMKPTIGNKTPALSIESHLLDFQRDIYGATISVCPQKFWRPEQKFPSLTELRKQLALDIAAAKKFHQPR
jgi:riboflavin kinase/FMN adenylyltransferase